jgi:hypothetical protein
MTTLLDIKLYIHDFVEENLDSSFTNKVYWLGERKNVPEYPYCLLNAISENKDKRTSTHNGELIQVSTSNSGEYDEYREVITTLYKTCTITVGIYNGWTEDTTEEDVDMDEAKEFAYQQINKLEELFETRRVQEDFYPNFSIQNISPIRPLHQVTDGGYMYRYEFDLLLGYNEPYIEEHEVGKQVEVEMTVDNDETYKIWFEVDGETGQINNLL